MSDQPATSLPDDSAAPCGAPVRLHVGVIDIGSNAIRLQVVRLFQDGTYKVIADDRDPVRLGSVVFKDGLITPDVWKAALGTIQRLASQARSKGVDRIRAVATSAMREAANGQDFLRAVKDEAGVDVEVISGDREARLIAKGVLSGFRHQPSRLVLADIGGGSTEVSVVEKGEVRFCVSLPLGSSRLTEKFCHSDPLSIEDERALREYVREELSRSIPGVFGPIRDLVGSAGTFGAVGNFIRRKVSPPTGQDAREKDIQGGVRFSAMELRRACTCLSAMDIRERRETKGIEERRAEIIVAGAILLQEIACHFSVEHLRGARRGLRDGLMLEELERLGAPSTAAAAPPARKSDGGNASGGSSPGGA